MSPNTQNMKKLFALSRNKCAFPRCQNELICEGVLVGEICHIKAASPGGKRYDALQSDSDRHGLSNLVLLCPIHHTVVDDDDETYTVEVLTRLKLKHEANSEPMTNEEAARGAKIFLNVENSSGFVANNITGGVFNINSTSNYVDGEAALLQDYKRAFSSHSNCVKTISKGKGSVQLIEGSVLVMHVAPVRSPMYTQRVDFERIANNPDLFQAMGAFHMGSELSYEGLYCWSNPEGHNKPQRSYTRVTRDGIVEAVQGDISSGKNNEYLILPFLQETIHQHAAHYAGSLTHCGVSPNYLVLVSLVNAKGKRLLRDFPSGSLAEDIPFGLLGDSILDFGTVLLTSVPRDKTESASKLKPILNHLANAAGLPSAPYFTPEGNYIYSFNVIKL